MKSDCPSKLVMERFFLEGGDEIRDHVDACTVCQEKMALRKEEKEGFLQQYPFERLWNAIRPRPKERISRFWERFLLPVPLRAGLAFATVACLMLFAFWHQTQSPVILSKGGSGVGLGFYVSHAGKVTRGKDRMSIPTGDDLQFVYSSPGEGWFLFLFGVEADRTVTVYYPYDANLSGPIESGKKNRLPQALRWQPHSAYERFFAIFSEEPISRGVIESSLQEASGKSVEGLSRFPLPYPQVSFILYRK